MGVGVNRNWFVSDRRLLAFPTGPWLNYLLWNKNKTILELDLNSYPFFFFLNLKPTVCPVFIFQFSTEGLTQPGISWKRFNSSASAFLIFLPPKDCRDFWFTSVCYLACVNAFCLQCLRPLIFNTHTHTHTWNFWMILLHTNFSWNPILICSECHYKIPQSWYINR